MDTIKHKEMWTKEILMDYSKQMMKFGGCFLRLLSECLGLDRFNLNDMDCKGAWCFVPLQ
uniref:Uncharacterized protein n=1 Tax=Solanum lycopersicum TaxID=4081 RepID=K4DEZ9_SOLLC